MKKGLAIMMSMLMIPFIYIGSSNAAQVIHGSTRCSHKSTYTRTSENWKYRTTQKVCRSCQKIVSTSIKYF